MSLAALGGFVPAFWICDLLSQFRLVIALCLLVCLCLLFLIRAKRATAVCAVIFVINLGPIFAMFLPAQNASAQDGSLLKVLNFNTEFQHNTNQARFEELVHKLQPDIICLTEVDQKWIDSIQTGIKLFPYSKVVMKGAGMALFSKYPIETCDVRYYGKSNHPRIFTQIEIDQQKINLILAHPTTPKSDFGYKERTEEFAIIENEIKKLGEPVLLVGDLNCGPWAPAFGELLDKAGLQDSQQGLGPQPSWPARTGRIIENVPIPPFVPIDHVLVSKKIVVVERQAGPAIGSDHLPVFVKLMISRSGN